MAVFVGMEFRFANGSPKKWSDAGNKMECPLLPTHTCKQTEREMYSKVRVSERGPSTTLVGVQESLPLIFGDDEDPFPFSDSPSEVQPAIEVLRHSQWEPPACLYMSCCAGLITQAPSQQHRVHGTWSACTSPPPLPSPEMCWMQSG